MVAPALSLRGGLTSSTYEALQGPTRQTLYPIQKWDMTSGPPYNTDRMEDDIEPRQFIYHIAHACNILTRSQNHATSPLLILNAISHLSANTLQGKRDFKFSGAEDFKLINYVPLMHTKLSKL